MHLPVFTNDVSMLQLIPIFLEKLTITLKNDFRASLPINLPVKSISFIPFSCDHLQIHEVDQPYHSKNLRNFHAGSEEEYISISSNVKIRHCISNGTGTTGKRFRVKYEVVGTYFLLIIRCYQKEIFTMRYRNLRILQKVMHIHWSSTCYHIF